MSTPPLLSVNITSTFLYPEPNTIDAMSAEDAMFELDEHQNSIAAEDGITVENVPELQDNVMSMSEGVDCDSDSESDCFHTPESSV
jgi:hypothetical protein